jgi:(p)ppGpp synthase/HD superfamily hydrolase
MNMSKIEIIQYVKEFADTAHGEQVRKYTGDRYIVHPVRVMEMTSEFSNDICVHAAALLHDVLEDTPVTADQMEKALLQVMSDEEASKVIQLVVELTDIYVKENYPRMNRRARKEKEAERLSRVSPDAQSVKYADIIDNIKDLVSQDTNFAKVYVDEAKKMLDLMVAGNPKLRERAVKLVDEAYYNLRKPAALCNCFIIP